MPFCCCAPEREALHFRVPVRADVPAVPKLVAHELDDAAHCACVETQLAWLNSQDHTDGAAMTVTMI